MQKISTKLKDSYSAPSCDVFADALRMSVCDQSPTNETFNLNDPDTNYSGDGNFDVTTW